MFKTRNLVIISLMIGLKIVLSQFSIFITPTFKLFSIAYLPGAIVSILYGPWVGIVFGFVGDLVGYVAKPAGPFFIGYTISEMVSLFLYGIFLYGRKLTIWRITLVRVLNLLLVSFGLNFIWSKMLYGATAGSHFNWLRIVNNLINLPISILLIYALGKLVLKIEKGKYS